MISCVLMIIAGCSSNQKEYEEAIEKGLHHLEQEEYKKAEVYFEQALEYKENDERAKALLEQTVLIQQIIEHAQKGELDEAETAIDQLMAIQDGSDWLVNRAKEIKDDLEALRSEYEDLVAKYDEARDLLHAEQFDEAQQLLEDALDQELNHAYFNNIKQDLDTLLKDVMKAKEEAALVAQQEAEKKAEELKKAEEEKKKAEQEKQKQQEAKEAEKQQVSKDMGDFVGYWLTEDFACHITNDYIACAQPYSDFITYDEIKHVVHKSSHEVEVTYLDGTTSSLTLVNDKSALQTPAGYTFIRVSKDEANAIFDGYYELP